MPMHPVVVQRRRKRRMKRLAVWYVLCAAFIAAVETGVLVWQVSAVMKFGLYGFFTIPLFVLNLWFLFRDFERERLFAAAWKVSPHTLLDDVLQHDASHAKRSLELEQRVKKGRKKLGFGCVAFALCATCLYFGIYPVVQGSLMLVLSWIGFVLSGLICAFSLPEGMLVYVSSRTALRVIEAERQELALITRHAPQIEELQGGLSRVVEHNEQGGVTLIVGENE